MLKVASETLMELETKGILLDIFKEKQQKSAEPGTIPSFYMKKPEDGSISHKVQRTDRPEMPLDQEELSFCPFIFTFLLLKPEFDISELDEDSDGFLQHHEIEAYIRGLIPNLAQLRDMPTQFVQMCCRIASQKFLFFFDPNRRDVFLALDKDMNGTLSKQELREYADGTLTYVFIDRVMLSSRGCKMGRLDCQTGWGMGGFGKRDVHQKWIEGGNYELCIEDVRDEIWDMVKPADPLRVTLVRV
ncbi:probable serine/threonine-protein phosphatase 2A regulatory subunit B'' subunit TON2 [Tanacetum coccineum]